MIRLVAVALGAALAIGGPVAAAPLEAYGRLPAIEDVAVSQSGKLLAMVLTTGEARSIAVESLPERNRLMLLNAGEAKVRDIRWAGDQHLIITASTTKQPAGLVAERNEWNLPFALDISRARLQRLLTTVRATDAMNTIHGLPKIRIVDGKPLVFVVGQHFVTNRGQLGLFRVDLETGAANLVRPGARGRAYDWVVDARGEPVAEALYHAPTGVWSVLTKRADGRWAQAYETSAPIETPDLIGLGRDGRSVAVSLDDEKLGRGWRELALDTGAWGDKIPDSDTGTPILDAGDGRVVGKMRLIDDDLTYTFYDAPEAAVWRGISKAYAGELVRLVSWSADRKKIVVRVESKRLGPAFALVDRTTGLAHWLGAEYRELSEADISPVQPVRYKAADGLEISGYLALPRGREARNLPLIVLPHGGPASRDVPGFDWWAQALASRGFAVLQPNFRGSSGYGDDFLAAGFGEWGRKMQTDLSDGVRELVRRGVVDPRRVCIVGASYGGYAALAGATIDKGVYRCAVSVGGVADLRALVTEPGYSGQRYWRRFVGVEKPNDPVLATYSPTARAAEATVPILLIHGRDDTVVDISHSRRMAEALRRGGKTVELVELPGEDHWLSRGATRLQMLKATVDFLEKHNPPN